MKILLSQYTNFKLGGEAKNFLNAETQKSFLKILRSLKKSDSYFILGEGTNVLAHDSGFSGTVIKVRFGNINVSGNKIVAEAGAKLEDLIMVANRFGLSGLETLAGIPGTVGGAVYGNAGAYGREFSDCIKEVAMFDGKKVKMISKASCEFGYRDSVFKKEKWAILAATLQFERKNPNELIEKSKEIISLREAKYKPELLCAGSIFKNILVASASGAKLLPVVPQEQVIAGKIPVGFLLESIGAKGMKEGGIYVADFHGNLLINNGGGKALEAKKLIEILKARVLAKYGITLEEEVQYLGF